MIIPQSCKLFTKYTKLSGRQAIIREIRKNPVTILLGETGSGKTTRKLIQSYFEFSTSYHWLEVPQYILDSGIAGNKMIAVTQPRRVAATSLAQRVATERNVIIGTAVGYSVRFDELFSAQTRIKFLTDGMIIRELLSDPLLSQYGVVIVDEAHERTLRTDMLLSNLKAIQRKRNSDGGVGCPASNLVPLKVVIMSATLDAERFSEFYDKCVFHLSLEVFFVS